MSPETPFSFLEKQEFFASTTQAPGHAVHEVYNPEMNDGDRRFLEIADHTEPTVFVAGNVVKLEVFAGKGTLHVVELDPYGGSIPDKQLVASIFTEDEHRLMSLTDPDVIKKILEGAGIKPPDDKPPVSVYALPLDPGIATEINHISSLFWVSSQGEKPLWVRQTQEGHNSDDLLPLKKLTQSLITLTGRAL
ncbi:MAG TPA: hypothetical protein VK694_00680 [Verrucomicrobiae bacterium]|nr:hypothetical protein [Verrucomicrobiae bacterium]